MKEITRLALRHLDDVILHREAPPSTCAAIKEALRWIVEDLSGPPTGLMAAIAEMRDTFKDRCIGPITIKDAAVIQNVIVEFEKVRE